MDKIKIYINGYIINKNLLSALKTLYKRYYKLMDVYVFFTNMCYYTDEKKSLIEDSKMEITVIDKISLPEDINKMYLLIDNDYDFLIKWEKSLGKAIAFDFKKTSLHETWKGYQIKSEMEKEEITTNLRNALHLYGK